MPSSRSTAHRRAIVPAEGVGEPVEMRWEVDYLVRNDGIPTHCVPHSYRLAGRLVHFRAAEQRVIDAGADPYGLEDPDPVPTTVSTAR